MKILKSGIEMEPSELDEVKGGLCSCGCDIGYNGMRMSVLGEENGSCYCGCTCNSSTGLYSSEWNYDFYGGYIQINPPA